MPFDNLFLNIPVALLHVAAQHDIPVRPGPRNDVRLIILAVPHYVLRHVGGLGEDDLASRGIALRIFNAGESPGGVAGAVEDDLSSRAQERCLDVWKLLAHESHTVLIP